MHQTHLIQLGSAKPTKRGTNTLLKALSQSALFYSLLIILSSGCTHTAISPTVTEFSHPDTWQQSTQATITTNHSWPKLLPSSLLPELINEAISNNLQLAAQRENLAEIKLNISTSSAARLPSLSGNLNSARQKRNNAAAITENYDASLTLKWEIDAWRKLSDAQKQAQLAYQVKKTTLLGLHRQLAGDVAFGWYTLIEAKTLTSLFEQRLANLKLSLDIIERGYRQGTQTALAVYLSRDTLAKEASRTHKQRQQLFDAAVSLQRLLGRYPDGVWPSAAPLPELTNTAPLGFPSDLLTRRTDIIAAWNNLLATDTAFAIAHKQRFPKISITSTAGDSSSQLHQLFDAGSIAWSLLGNISQPVFTAGRLAAQEKQAKARVQQAEKIYIDTVFSAFAETEKAISQEHSSQAQYQASLTSEQNANRAYELSLQQYQRGLVNYTTVLEAQRRAFDAQTSVIQLRNEILQNRIALHLALGDTFSSTESILIK